MTPDADLSSGLTAFGLVCLFMALSARFLAKAERTDRGFMQFALFAAFFLFAGLIIWSQVYVLQGRFPPGDGEGYHWAGIRALEHFRQGTLPTNNLLLLNYTGYPAYFIAPLYALGGPEPVLVVTAQLILHAHTAMMIYRMTQCVEDGFPAGKYAFFFALFFADSIGLSLYFLKEALVLWFTVITLTNCVLIVRYGSSWWRLLLIACSCLCLTNLRMSNCSMLLPAVAVAFSESNILSRRATIALRIVALAIVAGIFSKLFDRTFDDVTSFMSHVNYREGVFGAASSPVELATVAARSPLTAMIYALKVFQAVFTGGLSAVRELSDAEYQLSRLNFASPLVSLGALWRLINLPVTMYGLFILLKHHRRRAAPVLVFSVLVMISMFIIGYGARWGLPGMVINCMAWGVGAARPMRLGVRLKTGSPRPFGRIGDGARAYG